MRRCHHSPPKNIPVLTRRVYEKKVRKLLRRLQHELLAGGYNRFLMMVQGKKKEKEKYWSLSESIISF